MEEKKDLIKKIGTQIDEVKVYLQKLKAMDDDVVTKAYLVAAEMELERTEHIFEIYMRNTII